MSGKWLLNTNIIIALFANELSVQEHLTTAAEIFVPAIVLGELYYGARRSARVEANLARIDRFATASSVLLCDTVTAQHYGKIKSLLRAKGRPIPENDIWIAAIAQQYQLGVVSRDEHFEEVDGLALEMW
jgi:tRNA(fMet)-specific endonuclease VapC